MEEQRIEIEVPEHKEKERLDGFITRNIGKISRSQIQKLIKSGRITVNGRIFKSNHIVRPFEKIEITLPAYNPPEIQPENIPINITYEDDFLLVVNKEAGMVVHPAYGHSRGTLVHALLGYCENLSSSRDPYRPGIVHRLDKDTSGLIVVAKNDFVHGALSLQFSKKSVIRKYVALVWGKMKKNQGVIETFLGRSARDRKKITVLQEGKMAITHYAVKRRFDYLSLIELRLGTGRTHQIRVHLSHLGHPVFGDQTYGGRTRQLTGLSQNYTRLAVQLLKNINRQALHAQTLGFIHPMTGENMLFDSEIPEDMQTLLKILDGSQNHGN